MDLDRIDTWRVGKDSAGDAPYGPLKAYFYWRRENSEAPAYTTSFTYAELGQEIDKLRERGATVPPEYDAALKQLKAHQAPLPPTQS